jgi:SagB-type dehydrogenase family enzyme
MRASDVIEYHQRSKHQVNRYAPGPHGLDWANQPEPFRVFAGAPRMELPLASDGLVKRLKAIRRGELPPPQAFELRSVATLFELSLGLSAWKSFGGTRWALRCNPSSGNLHPTEGYLLSARLAGLSAGVYHYVSRDHILERRALVEDPQWDSLFASGGIVIGLSSIHWREAWKYGMRAWRYCQHDCGHAIAAVSYAAASLGWQTRLLEAPSDDLLAALLGLDRQRDFMAAEPEAPHILLWVAYEPSLSPDLDAMHSELARATWWGHANRLSTEHVSWPDIDTIELATRKPATQDPGHRSPWSPIWASADPGLDIGFATVARQRRSAVGFDGMTHIDAASLFAMLDALRVRSNVPPWNLLETAPQVHVALMVHRVTGLEPGLYVFLRYPRALAELTASMHREWLWCKVGPEALPLYLLLPYDLREGAKLICCHQDIAADSCFALGMLAPLGRIGDEPWRYRHLFWECGMVGHVLYLEAEAAGVRSTGIGCYFDDEMHNLLGITDVAWQSLYHFTTGGPTGDTRLSTLPPYAFQP